MSWSDDQLIIALKRDQVGSAEERSDEARRTAQRRNAGSGTDSPDGLWALRQRVARVGFDLWAKQLRTQRL